ncbi:hypothetical protein [uncultured Massilia sp.]|uniref:hypothetical protein n=1 Tax=uncultured Massilia sp. TaxID=169973 RepID=UPI002585D78B|nr:hypothetical protein [uncultured Massilia sp.]
MMRAAHVIASVCLLSTATLAAAQALAPAGDWASYRDAYRAMVVFDKYGGPKNLLQQHLQVLPREKGVLDEGLQLALAGKTVQTSLALDPLGRTVLPLLKAAYDENAVLTPSRRIGAFALRSRVSIAPQADNSYELSDLRGACEQALGFARHVDAAARSRQCVGVRMVFAKKGAEAAVRVRAGNGAEQALAPAPYAGEIDAGFPSVTYRFGPEPARVITYGAPLAIVPLFE